MSDYIKLNRVNDKILSVIEKILDVKYSVNQFVEIPSEDNIAVLLESISLLDSEIEIMKSSVSLLAKEIANIVEDKEEIKVEPGQTGFKIKE
jgi:FtsZ-binding cell division protein ZapB